MSDRRVRGSRSPCPTPFRTVGATTAGTAEEVEQTLAVLDALREDIRTRHAEDISRVKHEQACHDAQHTLAFEEPRF